MNLASLVFFAGLAGAGEPQVHDIEAETGIHRGLAVVLGEAPDRACGLARSGRWLVHLLVSGEDVERARSLVAERGPGGRVVVAPLHPEGRLPHPDRFVNLLIADLDRLGAVAPRPEEIDRVLALRGANFLRRDGKWRVTAKRAGADLDWWFAHGYDASGNCVSRDRIALFLDLVLASRNGTTSSIDEGGRRILPYWRPSCCHPIPTPHQ